MEWLTAEIDAYCERTEPGLWAEPVNALTNLAFIIAGVLMWRRTQGLAEGRFLSGVLIAVGIASGLFHTIAQGWSAALDTLAITVFAFFYIFLANRDFWHLGPWISAAGSAAYIPFSAILVPIFGAIPFFTISAGYWPLPLLIALYGLRLRPQNPSLGNGLLIGAGLLSLSLTFRSLDLMLCPSWPLGTHFLWHIINAVMLAWMIEVWRAHVRLEGKGPAR